MAFATLEDYNGEIEVTFFSGAWEKCAGKIEADKVAVLKGKIEYQKDKDRTSFLADEYLEPEAAETAAREEEAKARKWEKYRNAWKYMADLKLDKAAKAEKGNYTIMGILKSLREFTDKKGNEMAFGSLRDYSGEIDLVFFSSVWKECKDFLVVDEMTALKGNIDPAGDKNPAKPSFKVSSVPDLGRLVRAAAKKAAAELKPVGAGGGGAHGIEDDAIPGEETAAELAAAEIAAYDEPDTGEAAFEDLFPGDDFSDDSDEDLALAATSAAVPAAAALRPPAPSFTEYHVRLAANPAGREKDLAPLLEIVKANPGAAALLIHVPVARGERVVRGASGIGCTVDALSRCAEVAEAWAV
jgi:DNA polymerase-3 subunit alpha